MVFFFFFFFFFWSSSGVGERAERGQFDGVCRYRKGVVYIYEKRIKEELTHSLKMSSEKSITGKIYTSLSSFGFGMLRIPLPGSLEASISVFL